MAELMILGGGVAGISAAYHAQQLGKKAVIYEARPRWGGLADNFSIDGFRFDHAVHFAFTDDPYLSKIFYQVDYWEHESNPYNYERGRWLKFPVQNNLYPLPVSEKVEAIRSFVERPRNAEVTNYREWLNRQYGEVIAERFPIIYTKKYWTIEAEQLTTDWIGRRMYCPSLEEVLYGAMTEETPQLYHIKKMRYPKKGGFRAFLEPVASGLDIRTNKRAVLIDAAKRYVQFADGEKSHYQNLVTSVPLPDLIPMIKDVPNEIFEAAAGLWATSVAIVSVGFNLPRVTDHLWLYIYDLSILPARVYSPSLKSPDNAPEDCSSLQFEIYFSKHRPLPGSAEAMIEHVVDIIKKMKFASFEDIVLTDFRVLPYGNVVFDHEMLPRRRIVQQYLATLDILPIGRFGEWDYLWTDQCFYSGKKVENLLNPPRPPFFKGGSQGSGSDLQA